LVALLACVHMHAVDGYAMNRFAGTDTKFVDREADEGVSFDELDGGFEEYSLPSGMPTYVVEEAQGRAEIEAGQSERIENQAAYEEEMKHYKQKVSDTAPTHMYTPLLWVNQIIQKWKTGKRYEFRYDSIVFSSYPIGSESMLEMCKSALWVPGTCAMNELFLCSAMRGFTRDTYVSDRYSFFIRSLRDGFFRTVIDMGGWGVPYLKHIRVTNPHVVVHYKIGLHDRRCRMCLSEDSSDCKTGELRWDTHAEVNNYKFMEYNGEQGPVYCFWFELVPDANGQLPSCDLKNIIQADANLRGGGHGRGDNVIRLPDYIDQKVDTQYPSGVLMTEGETLSDARVITGCPAGWMHEEWPVSRCVPAECNSALRSNCVDSSMAAICATESGGPSAAGFEDKERLCMWQEYQTCLGYRTFQTNNAMRTVDDCEPVRYKLDGTTYFNLVSGTQERCAFDRAQQREDAPFEDGQSLVFEDPEFACGGAYKGRIACGEDPIHVTDKWPLEWIAGIDPTSGEPSCIACDICDPTLDRPRFYLYGCESWFGRAAGVEGSQLNSHNSVCVDCEMSNCPVGTWRDCSGVPSRTDRMSFENNADEDDNPKKKPTCGECSCDPAEAEAATDSFCLVNTTVCDGRSLVNKGAVVTSLDWLQCPVNQFRDKSVVFDARRYLDTSKSEMLLDACKDCFHPKEGAACDAGFTWPGCPGTGTVGNPECSACQIADPNVVYPRVTIPADECRFGCAIEFFKNTTTRDITTDTLCYDCRAQPRPATCQSGSYLTQCDGSEQVPSCTPCAGPQPFVGCSQGGVFIEECAGTGYVSSGGISNECIACRDEPSAGSGQECGNERVWKPCNAVFEDNSKCVNCEIPDHSVPAPAAQCGFYCNAGYYKTEKRDNSEVTTCRECTLDLAGVCGEITTGCASEGCDARAERDARCVCLPGFGWSDDLAGRGASPCTKCRDADHSPGGRAPCSACPLGYSGDEPAGGSTTCLPCAVNTYRGKDGTRADLDMRQCEACIAGTGGVVGSDVCKVCRPGSGFLAVENVSVPDRYVYNHAADANSNPWHLLVGTAATNCLAHADPTAAGSLQICRDMDYTSIRVKGNGDNDGALYVDGVINNGERGVGDRVPGGTTPVFYCAPCANGLAYSTTWGALREVFETIEGGVYNDHDTG